MSKLFDDKYAAVYQISYGHFFSVFTGRGPGEFFEYEQTLQHNESLLDKMKK